MAAQETRHHPSYYRVYNKSEKLLKEQNDTLKNGILRLMIDQLLTPCEGDVNFFDKVKRLQEKFVGEGIEISQTSKNLKCSIEKIALTIITYFQERYYFFQKYYKR